MFFTGTYVPEQYIYVLHVYHNSVFSLQPWLSQELIAFYIFIHYDVLLIKIRKQSTKSSSLYQEFQIVLRNTIF